MSTIPDVVQISGPPIDPRARFTSPGRQRPEQKPMLTITLPTPPSPRMMRHRERSISAGRQRPDSPCRSDSSPSLQEMVRTMGELREKRNNSRGRSVRSVEEPVPSPRKPSVIHVVHRTESSSRAGSRTRAGSTSRADSRSRAGSRAGSRGRAHQQSYASQQPKIPQRSPRKQKKADASTKVFNEVMKNTEVIVPRENCLTPVRRREEDNGDQKSAMELMKELRSITTKHTEPDSSLSCDHGEDETLVTMEDVKRGPDTVATAVESMGTMEEVKKQPDTLATAIEMNKELEATMAAAAEMKKKAMEDAEELKKQAAEAAEALKKEAMDAAEELKKQAMAVAEETEKQAMAAAEETEKQAMAAAEETKKQAMAAAEEVKQKAEEEMKLKAEEEMKLKAEEEMKSAEGYETVISDLKHQLTHIKEQLSSEEAKTKTTQEEFEQMQDKFKEICRKHEESIDKISGLKVELDTSKEQVKTSEEFDRQLKEQLEKAVEKQEKYRAHVMSLKAENEETRESVKQTQEQVVTLEEQVKDMNMQSEEKEQSLVEQRMVAKALSLKLDRVRNDYLEDLSQTQATIAQDYEFYCQHFRSFQIKVSLLGLLLLVSFFPFSTLLSILPTSVSSWIESLLPAIFSSASSREQTLSSPMVMTSPSMFTTSTGFDSEFVAQPSVDQDMPGNWFEVWVRSPQVLWHHFVFGVATFIYMQLWNSHKSMPKTSFTPKLLKKN